MRFGFPVSFHVVQPGKIVEDDGFEVHATPVRHRVEAWAYAMIEKDQPGRFDAEAAKALGIPFGPLYGALKQGECITLDDGRVVDGRALVGPTRPGRKVVFSGDTGPCTELVQLAGGADLLVHEATYAETDRALAERAAHSTSTIAATCARDAGVRSLLLTHFSSRYEGGESALNLDGLLEEARSIFPETRLAHDFLRFRVPREDE
jgi:ribonuclease Z